MTSANGSLDELKKEAEGDFKPMIERGSGGQMDLQAILDMDKVDDQFKFEANARPPFAAFLEKNFDFVNGTLVPKKDKDGNPLVEVSGKFLASKGTGKNKKVGFIECKGNDDFCKGFEKAKKLRESIFGDGGSSGSADGFANAEADSFLTGQIEIARGDLEYTPFMSGAFNKQLYMYDYNVMHSKAFEMWNHNPVAHQIIKITTFFVLGRGCTVRFKDIEGQQVWDAFCKKNKFYERLKVWSDMLSRDGELMVRYYKDRTGMNGDVQVRAVDPSTIWEVITDPEDIENVFYYHQQYPTQYQVFYSSNPLQIPSTKYVINQIPATDMKHYKINANANEKRGRSDLFPVMTWLKRLKDFYTARTIRGIIQASFVYKMIIKGSDADVQTARNNWGTTPPKSGTMWFENESATLSAMTLDIKASDARDDGEALLNLICVGVGIPKEYLGLGSSSTKATALVASEPAAKKFQDRQDLFKQIVSDVAVVVVEQAQAASVLPRTKKEMPENTIPRIIQALKKGDFFTALQLLATVVKGGNTVEVDKSFEVIMPEIAIEDRSTKMKDLTLMQVNGWVSKKTAGQIAAKEMHIDEYDFDEEQEQMKSETPGTPGEGELIPTVNPGTGAIRYKTPSGGAGAVIGDAINPPEPKPGLDRAAAKANK